MNEDILSRLRGHLIVSVQAYAGSLLNTPESIALLARVAEINGAAALRVEGVERIRAVCAATEIPVIGIIKREHPGFAPYITSTREEIEAVAYCGAEIIAFDATAREHAGGASIEDLVAYVHAAGCLAMADCATLTDGLSASEAGADILATTLAGYTEGTRGRPLPALDLVHAFARHHSDVICEGGVADPESLGAAFAAGASAVVVGTAITNIDALVTRFVAATPGARAAT